MKRTDNFLRWIFKNRGLVMAPPIIFATLCTWAETENNFIIFGLGGTVFIAGLLLRIWSQMHLHYRLKVHKLLTTTGPYGYVRNPIYIGNTLMLVAVMIMLELLWLAPLMLVYCAIIYSIVVRFEETHLLEKYDRPYAEYLSKIPRWIPRSASAATKAIINTRQFLASSLWAEAPSLLLLLPLIIKELLTDSFLH
jgi:protein-S-isoprenylcysteine O-methyltransferase Ste14